MAITWGSTVGNSGGNTLQVGIDLTQSPGSVSAGTSKVTVTAKIYVRTRGAVSYNGANLSLSGSWSGSYSFNVSHGSSGGQSLVRTVTRTVSPSYSGSTSSSLTASVSGLHNFGTAKHSRTVSTGRRPYSKPRTPSNVTVSKSGSSKFVVRWKRNATTAAPYSNIYVERSKNGGSWGQVAKLSGGATSYTDSSTSANASYRYRVRAQNSAGYSGYGTTGTATTKPNAPATPTGATVSRSSDKRQVVKWTNKASTAAPYNNVYVYRSTNNGAWGQIAVLGGGATTYTDTGTRNNAFYRYRVRARNAAGYSGYATTSYVTTTPAKPPAPKATRRGATITVDTGTNLPRATNRIEIFDSVDGANPVRVATVSARTGVNTRWTHQNPDTTKTHAYTVRARGGTPEDASGYIWGPQSSPSNTVQLLTAPAAPKLTAASGLLVPYGDVLEVELGWSHQSIDSTEQTAYELRLDYGEGFESLGRVDGADETYTLDISESFPPSIVRWQVRTWGEHADPSPWSPVGVLTIKTPPSVAVITPEDGSEQNSSTVPVEVEFETDETTNPQRWEAYLVDAADEGENQFWRETGPVSQDITLPELEEQGTYILAVRVRDTAGLWSGWAETTFTIKFLPPPAPVVESTEWDIENGAVYLSITAPEPGDGEDVTASFDVYRLEQDGEETRAVTLLKQVAPDEAGVVTDHVPPLNTSVLYLVRARTGYGASADTTETVETPARGWCYVNGGAAFSTVSRIRDNLKTDYTHGREKQLHQFAGRRYPVEFQGRAKTLKIGMSGRLGGGSSTLDEWLSTLDATPPLCFRDATLKAFVSAGDLSTSYERVIREISVDFEGVDYDESTSTEPGFSWDTLE